MQLLGGCSSSAGPEGERGGPVGGASATAWGGDAAAAGGAVVPPPETRGACKNEQGVIHIGVITAASPRNRGCCCCAAAQALLTSTKEGRRGDDESGGAAAGNFAAAVSPPVLPSSLTGALLRAPTDSPRGAARGGATMCDCTGPTGCAAGAWVVEPGAPEGCNGE